MSVNYTWNDSRKGKDCQDHVKTAMKDFSDSREASHYSEDRLKSTILKTWALSQLGHQVKKFAAIKWYSKEGNKSSQIQTERHGTYAKLLCYVCTYSFPNC